MKIEFRKPARLVIQHRPRLGKCVVLLNNKVVHRAARYEDCQSFIKGWRKSEDMHNARVDQYKSGLITADEFYHFSSDLHGVDGYVKSIYSVRN